MLKSASFKIKGMQRDLSVSAFNPEYAYENKNIRIMPTKENTLLSIINEKGNKLAYIEGIGEELQGIPIGQSVLDDELIIFTAKNSDNPEVPDIIPTIYYANTIIGAELDANINNFTDKIYFDDGAKVEITALPSENGRHTFEYYILNESSEKIHNNPIIITDAKDDIIVDTYFKEWWINIQTQPRPNVADIHVPEGSDMYHLREDILHVNIENIQEGWQFKKWADASISDIELEKYIIEGNLTTPDITVQVDASISSGKYDLIANFIQ